MKYEYRSALDPDVLKHQPEAANFDDADFTTALVRVRGGHVIEVIAFDGGEPEDNSFTRDWSWVAGALKNAYDRGFNDGYHRGKPRDVLDMD